jgi:uncharacterized protein involved in exopolysaccharide biosynthesis
MEYNDKYTDLWTMIFEIKKKLKKVMFICGSAVLLALIVTLFMVTKYTAETTILPSLDGSSGGEFGKIASMAGLKTGESENREHLFGEIVESDQVLLKAIDRDWYNQKTESMQKLHLILDIEASGPDGSLDYKERQDFLKYLKSDVITFTRNTLTGFMTLRVTVPEHPKLASDIVNYLARAIDFYVRESQTEIKQERLYFSTQRVESATTDLNAAENKLSVFKKRNASWAQSPELTTEYSRLAREVEAMTAIWVGMRKQQEFCRTELLNNHPAVIVLDAATPPTKKSSPHLILNMLVGAIIGLALSLLYVFCLPKEKKSG